MANWSTGKPKIGDTRGWNERDQTGYKWDGKKWVQYYKGQPLGPFKGHGGITGNVDVVGGVKSGILGSANRIGRAISGAPSDEDYQFVEEQGGRINKPTPVDGEYGDNLEFTMGFNPDSEPIIKGLTDGFTGNLEENTNKNVGLIEIVLIKHVNMVIENSILFKLIEK